jgi:hypothetical protein
MMKRESINKQDRRQVHCLEAHGASRSFGAVHTAVAASDGYILPIMC